MSSRLGRVAKEDLLFALELADRADATTMGFFGAVKLQTERKANGSPVSEADRAVERVLLDLIAATRPGHSVLSEEAGAVGEGDWRWIIDPIDGTSSFIRGGAMWGTGLALEFEGRLVVGVFTQPSRRRRWWAAAGMGAWTGRGTRLNVSPVGRLSDACLVEDYGRRVSRWARAHPANRLASICQTSRPTRGWPLHALVANGSIDVALQCGAHSWDLAPWKVIVEEAGGCFTDMEGGTGVFGGAGLTTNGRLHDQALACLSTSI